jgi:hypothetical protein
MRVLALFLAALGLFSPPASPQQAEPAKPAKTTPAPKAAEASQRPAEARQAKEAKAEAPAKPAGQLVNIRIDVKITDERGSQTPVAKVVSLTVADGGMAFIRSTAEAPFGAKTENLRVIPLHVDATPRIEGSKVRLKLSLEYNAVDVGGEPRQYPKMEIRENLSLVLENEKPLLVAESPDPLSDRRVNVEVKATILK